MNVMLDKAWGGTEQMALSYNRALAGRHEVINVVDPASEARARLLAAGERTVSAYYPFNVDIALDVRTVFQMAVAMRRYQPDIVLAHNFVASLNAKGAQALSFTSAPLVRVFHTEQKSPPPMARTDFGIAVSRGIENQVTDIGLFSADKMATVHNFLDMQAPILKSKKVGAELRVGYLGRVTTPKGADLFIESVHAMAASGRRVVGVIGGTAKNDKDDAAFKAMAQNGPARFEWKGWVDDKKSFFDDIDVLVLPSKKEAFGLVILEAWAHGVPVVATKTVGPNELIHHERNGLLADFDAADIARQTAKLAGRPGLYTGVRARAYAGYNAFTLERQGDVLGATLERFAEQGTRSAYGATAKVGLK